MNLKLKAQIDQLEKAGKRLEEVLVLEPTQINKDAAIQRFEFTFELAWKTIRSFAFEKGFEVISPRDNIRTAAQLGLIENIEIWFDFLEARNNSSHVYNENMASVVYEEAKKFLPEFKKLLEKLENTEI